MKLPSRPIRILLLFSSLLAAVQPLPPDSAYACSRGEFPAPLQEYMDADAVFTAEVISDRKVYYGGSPMRQLTLAPESPPFKGQAPRTVLTALDSDQCGASAATGDRYLFYSHRSGGLLHRISIFDMKTAPSPGGPAPAGLHQPASAAGHPEPAWHLYYRPDVRIHGEKGPLPTEGMPVIYDHSLYLPLSFYRGAFGLAADWLPEEHTVSFRSTGAAISTTGSAALPEDEHAAASGVPFFPGIRIVFDGTEVPSSEEPFLLCGELYVPLRPAAEQFGYEAAWTDGTVELSPRAPFASAADAKLALKLVSGRMDGPDLVMEQLGSEGFTYRIPESGHAEEPDARIRTGSFKDLTDPDSPLYEHGIRLFLSSAEREAELAVDEALISRLPLDPVLRTRLGAALGRPLPELPAGWLLTEDHLPAPARPLSP
ncbi:hypothetical protein PM3016_5334 [Paenibacillus mucilaginosus 3016]|uniref:Uncharacterized protein n=1 Tax=Paenibacillus mucilaginosus 3016 TaxID=1116391 RepID=H6NB69_9BACL|nr:stalk domain-containing protein [Paenibacillus mucilaginosus]AFC32037.1 hypothetical protein PM3016_5334 [Paenibacillus mucilaginosus 3016]WFA20548.1 hypothetical protein ERY13_26570 [Paenibacillus mucilaginosus]